VLFGKKTALELPGETRKWDCIKIRATAGKLPANPAGFEAVSFTSPGHDRE
jgi:hypothetical protein